MKLRSIFSLTFIIFSTLSFAQVGKWTWIGGSKYANDYGMHSGDSVYPRARIGMCGTIDQEGNVWMYGGIGLKEKNQSAGLLNDLWKWDGNEWQLLFGTDSLNNLWEFSGLPCPSARKDAACFIDSNGIFYVFGGNRIQSKGKRTLGNDLWRFDQSINKWTLISGDTSKVDSSHFVIKGKPDPENLPGSRSKTCYWQKENSLYIYGGVGYNSKSYGTLNEVWKWQNGAWSIISGNEDLSFSYYGKIGQFDSLNLPPARFNASLTSNNSTEIVLFGGSQLTATDDYVERNDLWKFNGNDWAWITGSQSLEIPINYCLVSELERCNPGSRGNASSWALRNGEIFLFGGYLSYFKKQTTNDLWFWDNQYWHILYNGKKDLNQPGKYTKSQWPGARSNSINWADSLGNLWLFGGIGYDADSTYGYLNDLWRYEPDYSVNVIGADSLSIGIRLFPNPANDQINVFIPNVTSYKIDVYNLSGTLLQSISTTKQYNQISIANFSNGIYYLSVSQKNSKSFYKFIVTHN